MQLLFPRVASGSSLTTDLINFLNASNHYLACDDNVCESLRELTQCISSASKRHVLPEIYNEVQAICFWLRPASLQQLQRHYAGRVGRGVCFQIAPSNVDTLFFYSMCCGLLAGNSVLIRVSEHSGIIGEFLLQQLRQFVESNSPAAQLLSQRLRVVSYPRHSEFTAIASSLCDSRVVWGSDQSIAHVQQTRLKATATEVNFGHRYSLCLLTLSHQEDAKLAAQRLVADCKPFHQQACASPIVVVWLETDIGFQTLFWQEVQRLASDSVPWKASPIAAQDKVDYLQRLAFHNEPIDPPLNTPVCDANFLIIPVKEITRTMLDWHPGQGCLLSVEIESLNQLTTFAHCQTLAVFGIDSDLLHADLPRATIRRICSLGTSLTFSSTWDGVDLIDACSITSGEPS